MLKQENYETMTIERRDDQVAIVTLNRPERLNAVNGRMHAELATFSRDFANDRDMRVMVLTGAGRAFCADLDGNGSRCPGGRLHARVTRRCSHRSAATQDHSLP